MALALMAMASFAGAQQMRIQYAEPISIPAGTGSSSFDAYGRRFQLQLQRNDRVTASLPAARKAELQSIRILRGALPDQPHSWVRLTESGDRIEGAIWDGTDLYVVTNLGQIAANLTTPVNGPENQAVVYRLSDTLDALPRGFCADGPVATQAAPKNGLAQYKSMVAELALRAIDPLTVSSQIEISLIGDLSFQNKFGANASMELLARHNVVDGIYAEQVGIFILAGEVRLAPASPDPFTKTDASGLLDQLASFRTSNPPVSSFGLAHLVTGRMLDGTTIGIAYRGGVCSAHDGVSLTEGSFSATRDALVMAHELGHNFGSPHDGVETCAATPQGVYIMSPVHNGSSTFSQCSLDSMRPVIQNASCVVPANYSDVELPPPGTELVVENDVPLVVPYAVKSAGTQTVQAAHLSVTAPPGFSITAVSDPAACAIAGNVANCDLGDIPGGQVRNLTVSLLPSGLGTFSIEARVSAANNRVAGNDAQSQRVRVVGNADLAVSLNASASSVLAGDPVDFTVVATSVRSHAIQNGTVEFNIDSYRLRADSASVTGGGSCTVTQSSVYCNVGTLPAGESRTLTVHTTARYSGTASAQGSVRADNDSSYDNNSASRSLRIDPVRDVGLEEVSLDEVVRFGMPFEFKANLRAFGLQAVNGVSVSVFIAASQAGLDDIQSVTVGGAACSRSQPSAWDCTAGSMNPGETRALSIKGTSHDPGGYSFSLLAAATSQDNLDNDTIYHRFTVRYGLDAAVVFGNVVGGPEGMERSGYLTAFSEGLESASDAVLNVDLPPQAHFTRFESLSSTGPAPCEIVNPQRLRCAFASLAQNASQSINYWFIGDVPGNYQVNARITVAGDEFAGNDTVSTSMHITPLVNVGVTDTLSVPLNVLVGSDATIPFSVFTGPRPVPGVTLRVDGGAGKLRSISSPMGSCVRFSASIFDCTVGDLQANALLNFSTIVGEDTLPLNPNSFFSVRVTAPGDNYADDDVQARYYGIAPSGDLSVSLSGARAIGSAGASFPLPTIYIAHEGVPINGRVQVTLPAGVKVTEVSGSNLICSGTTTLQCDLPYGGWQAGQVLQLSISLTAPAATTFISAVHVSASNDVDDSNDSASIAVTVNTAPDPPAVTPDAPRGSSSGGKGGGGRLEWLVLTLLLSLTLRRSASRSVKCRTLPEALRH